MISIERKSKLLLVLSFCVILAHGTKAQTSFVSKEMKVNIFSSTPLEDIKAQATNASSVIVLKTKQIAFQVPVKNFVFSRSLMQEHFNESYMESDKYPTASFKGNIQQDLDFSKDGIYDVTVKGILNMHGVSKERTINGKIEIINGKPNVSSSFEVASADHKIKIPSVVFKKIAETITVTVKGSYN